MNDPSFDSPESQRRITTQLIAIGTLVLLFHGFHDAQGYVPIIGYIEWVYAGLGVICFVVVLKTRFLQIVQRAVLLALLPLLWLVLISGGRGGLGPIWLAIYPLLALFFRGRKEGSWWLWLFVGGIVAQLIAQALGVWRTAFLFNELVLILSCIGVFALFVYTYEAMRRRAADALLASHQELQQEITERRAAEARLAQANAELEELVEELASAIREKSDILAVVAHDLRSPIAGTLIALRSYDEMSAENQMVMRQGMLETLQHLSQVVARLLQPASTAMRKVPMIEVARRARSLMLPQAAAKNIRLELLVEPASASGQADSLVEVVENLLSNAVKFSPPHSVVDIVVRDLPEVVRLEVRDQGPGLTAEDQQLVFRQRGTLSAKPSQGEPSSGLGLYICKRYIDQMGGHIGYSDNPTGGAIFFLELKH